MTPVEEEHAHLWPPARRNDCMSREDIKMRLRIDFVRMRDCG